MKIATYGVLLLAFLSAALLKLARANEAGRAINAERGDA